ncbi:16S rRNA (cytidine(1402)-2'-O)-methyltransferase [Devriesea agamarum]|uniref:16S rRNA (cytidine(1402)-2'-O)-methyltransferase n=1 Tax=Devriesea agamarum TaxID=472569 RepID=UPI000A0524F3|nr:16S rRNA (cytidine(1402)-2'-O)-methyltransferase [Devriesea agamarum]
MPSTDQPSSPSPPELDASAGSSTVFGTVRALAPDQTADACAPTGSGLTPVLHAGELTLAATPIGNPLDASMRLVRALEEADLIAAEDTRRLHRLARDLGLTLSARVISHHEHNEDARTMDLLSALEAGQRVVIVTDAGMPVISDPGYRAVCMAHEAGIRVRVLPGPSAVLTALAMSGLAPDRFAFEGFLPRKPSKREEALKALRDERRTLVFFESPRRTADTVQAMRDIFGPERQAALTRELTKTHEEVVRGTLAELVEHTSHTEVLGEVVLVVAGAATVAVSIEDLVQDVRDLRDQGMRLKDAAKQVAAAHRGVGARDLYDAARD